jgi:hypothetical protein
MDGGVFEHAYLRAQIIDHQTTVQLLEWEIGSGEVASFSVSPRKYFQMCIDASWDGWRGVFHYSVFKRSISSGLTRGCYRFASIKYVKTKLEPRL